MPKKRDWRKLLVGRAEKAIKQSIAHWKRMRKKKPTTYAAWTEEEPSTHSCTLCRWAEFCSSCPITLLTGAEGCLRAPYEAASVAWESIRGALTVHERVSADLLAEWRDCADKMIAFLEGML